MQALQVTIPTGVKPGDKFKARVNSDRTVTVTCPPNCAAGTVVRISVPPAKMKVSGGLLPGSSWQTPIVWRPPPPPQPPHACVFPVACEPPSLPTPHSLVPPTLPIQTTQI